MHHSLSFLNWSIDRARESQWDLIPHLHKCRWCFKKINSSHFIRNIHQNQFIIYQHDAVSEILVKSCFYALLLTGVLISFTGITEFNEHPASTMVSEGSVARFSCAVTSTPSATITWEFNQSTLPLQTDRYFNAFSLFYIQKSLNNTLIFVTK